MTERKAPTTLWLMLDRHRMRRPHARSWPLPERALDDLRYIRETMERSAAFTASPGWGQVLMGLTALPAAWIAARQSTSTQWLTVWLAEALMAVAIAIAAIQIKARRTGVPLTSGPGRKFALGFLPAIAVALLLTAALYRASLILLLPGTWLLLYGSAVFTGGAFSIPLVRIMGFCFLITGTLALFLPAWGNLLMAAGFGGLHIVFGTWIGRKHGG